MKKNIIKEKSFIFATKIIRLSWYLQNHRKEFVLSKQILKSGTAIGALIRESEHAESKLDFVHKLAIAQKECNETIYWLELLNQTNYIDKQSFMAINEKGIEILKILASIIKTLKSNIKH